MTRAYPLPAGPDSVLTSFGLAHDIGKVFELHGMPRPTPADFVALREVLLRFVYNADPETPDELLDGLEKARATEPTVDPRTARIADARQMLNLLEANPDLPFRGIGIQEHAMHGTDEENHDEIDRVAAILDATPTLSGTHYQVAKRFGRASYGIVAIPKDTMRRWGDQLRLGEEALSAAEAAVAKAAAGKQDEDQPPAARGHVQGDCERHAMPRHAMPPIGAGTTPRCGAAGPTALFASDVTCRDCRSLMAEQARATGEPDFIDAGDDSRADRQIAEDDWGIARQAADEARREQAWRQRAIDCDDSCGGEGVCAFGPHDPITTPPTTSSEEAP